MKPDQRTGSAPRSSRRGFLEKGVVAVGGVFALLAGIPIVGLILSPLFKRPPHIWAKVCSLDEIGFDEPRLFAVEFPRRDGSQEWVDRRGVFVIRRGGEILAFSNICTHMSCSVRWLPERQRILCPCHGGMYDRWGILAGGPPAFDLFSFEQRVEGNDLYVANRTFRRG